MKKISLLIVLICAFGLSAQKLYIRTFGKSTSEPVIFLHGGPGYNSSNFEATTASRLAENGFFVIVYDRRGEGRSEDKNAKYTFDETLDDINSIYKQFSLKKAILIGHSFGGVVGVLYAQKYPENIQSLVLVGAPVSLQQSFKTIIRSSKAIYVEKKDSANLKYVNKLEKMDTNSIAYSSFCFSYAMRNGFYSVKQPTEEAKTILGKYKTDSLAKFGWQMSAIAPQGFWKNEHYTTLDLKNNIKQLVATKTKVFGLYGKEDGLYSPEQVAELESILPKNSVSYFDNCSHNVFIDQQTEFINAIKKIEK